MSMTDGESARADSQTSDGTSTVTNGLPTDDVFHILQNCRRRAVIRYLRDEDGGVEMGDIAEQVTAWGNDTTVQVLTSEEYQ